GQTFEVISPSDGLPFAAVARGGAEDIDRAVKSARKALSGPWGRLSATERGRILTKMAGIILERAEELAQLEARDNGKPLTQARADMQVTARYFEFYGAAADKVHGQVIPFLDGYTVTVLREPHGVTGHIIPWNYPAQMFGRTMAPALAMGNTCVMKPAEDACLSSLEIARIAMDADMPPGVVNIVSGYGEEAGAALAAHRDINLLSFTGSSEVGTLVQQAAAKHHVPCVLELGGKSPQVIFADADLEQALPVVVKAIIQNAGQTCSAGARLLLEVSIYEQFVAQVAQRFKQLRVGTHDMDLDVGPVINLQQKNRVERFIKQAQETRVPLLAEGALAANLPAGGFFVKPALFGPVPRDHALACDEVFGPVLSALPFKDEQDAVELANATDYGLVGAVWTRDGGRQQRVSKAMRCGQVFINCYGAGGGVELPFGGMKKSGHGREKGFLALEHLSTTKTVVNFHG
ncbi:MAG: aldehyde dehydrogenase family protein, partial [Betaproteobacteria bacterium]